MLVTAIYKFLRIGARVRLVVGRLTIVACFQVVPIDHIEPARIACIPIIESLDDVGMWGIDAGERGIPPTCGKPWLPPGYGTMAPF